ncbi:hypothetical protein CVIRNUC_009750 [Coccomyxa viridis]|uniref:phosphatidyl-N-methylethanolamine N-methyltransferase n=1 Tax=Coccomyxa viridis TaxID=1274662 RepID=A0AAV1IK08_9CHLO|nr:hypothetical protein CVIRNUC_009750 [Coccomyxa viridis]
MGAIDSSVIAAITAPHLLYAFVWFLPALWRQVFSKPVRAFQTSATVLKVLQVVILLRWYSVKSQHEGLKGLNLMKVPMGQWGAFFLCVFLGQVLNIAVYRVLGEKGVYYGSRLGKKVAWHKEFPFNLVSHPQYVGAVLTITGFSALVYGQAPQGAMTLAGYWASLYAVTALQEQFL